MVVVVELSRKKERSVSWFRIVVLPGRMLERWVDKVLFPEPGGPLIWMRRFWGGIFLDTVN